MSNIVHFENLWEKSEKAIASEGLSEKEILGKLSSTVEQIRDIYTAAAKSNDKQLIQGMKSKAVGRLLVALSAFSAKENIDVYAAMKDQLDILNLKEKATI